ncbi:enediyne antibiotic chromoprotein [Streptomyces cahuitamycinicus]|uniref:Neocarzinostatin n=1 Tax=Streptomyces cahuitamycinicus TaxID=2070367 RepID=A0A2N8TXT2_9ACTN|nr:enediyne antibiotic chromoprotein [Streptomyces cahuitamycinicus]PNG23832.1 neocarzinostatin [Streptomyces cahuitamycinicus]
MVAWKSRFASIVGGSALAVGLAVAFQPSAAALASPTVTVTPSSGLADGDTVQVAASGLEAGTTYNVGQCAEVEPGAMACNSASHVRITANADGTLKTQLTVNRSFAGVLFDDTHWGTVDCATAQCVVGLSDDAVQGPAPVAISFR